MFNIARKVGSEGKDYEVISNEHGLPLAYPDGRSAALEAERLTAETGVHHKPQRMMVDWRAREEGRFKDGTYQKLPWATDRGRYPWYNPITDHFAHPSKKEPGLLAYTANENDGLADKQTAIKAGKYLERFFNHSLDKGSVAFFAQEFQAMFEKLYLRFAKTADEIEYVYRNGPESCMSGDAYRASKNWGPWASEYHPTRIYEGDFLVAYIKNLDDRITGRALVRPAAMTHSRVYGDEIKMKKLLEEAGYVPGPPIGGKVKRHFIKGRGFVAPYIDYGQGSGGGSVALVDRKDHLQIIEPNGRNVDIVANTLTGIAGGRYLENMPYACGCCHNEFPRQSLTAIPHDGLMYCQGCLESNFYICGYSGEYFPKSDPHVTMNNGTIWRKRFFDRHGFTCPIYNLNLPQNEGRAIVEHEDGAARRHYSRRAASELAFLCAYMGVYVLNKFKVILSDSRTISTFEWKDRKTTLEGNMIYAVNIGGVDQPKPKSIAKKLLVREAERAGYKYIIDPTTMKKKPKPRQTEARKRIDEIERLQMMEDARRSRKSQKARSNEEALAYAKEKKNKRITIEAKKKLLRKRAAESMGDFPSAREARINLDAISDILSPPRTRSRIIR